MGNPLPGLGFPVRHLNRRHRRQPHPGILWPHRTWLRCTIATSLIICSSLVSAGSVQAQSAQIRGLERTDRQVVERELSVDNQPLPITEGIQRLRNLRIFSSVTAATQNTTETIYVREKWTLIPIVRGAATLGVANVILGAYDVNFLGKYIEVGGQYEYLGGSHSGVVWWRDPRFRDSRWRVGADLWSTRRNYNYFDPDGRVLGGYSWHRYRVNLFTDKEIRQWLTVGVGLDTNFDSFDDRSLGSQLKDRNLQNGLVVPDIQGWSNYYVASLALGRLDYDDFLVSGWQLDADLRRAGPETGSDDAHVAARFDLRWFVLAGNRLNLGSRLSAGAGTSTRPQHLFYLGGLDFVRGYGVGQVRGARFAGLNGEVRILAWRGDRFALQNVVFTDTAVAANVLRNAGRIAWSAGSGIRLVFPTIFRFVVRADYAWAHGQAAPHGLAVGVQQFF